MGPAISVEEIRRDIETKREKIIKDLKKAIDNVKKIPVLQKENGEWDEDLLNSISIFFETYFSFEKIIASQYDLIQKYQHEAGQSLSESISVICKVIMKGLEMGYRDKAGKLDTHQFKVLSQSLHTLVNYSDCTPKVTKDIAGEPNFLETIKGTLTKFCPDHSQDKAKAEDEKVIEWCLAIYYNISLVDDNIPLLCNLDIVPVFISFHDGAQVQISRLTALSTLANIIDEKESVEILQGKPDVIKFLLKKLGLALKNPHHKDKGWSAEKCARTMCRLARNDANKTLLVEMGCLPHLVELVKSGNKEEKRKAVGVIHILTVHQENRKKIVQYTKLMDMLIEIKENSSDKEVRKAVDETFKNLQEELQKNNNYKYLVPESSESNGAPVKDRKGHIMISYEQSNQETLIKIRDILKTDYVVCMHNDNTAEVMAKSVEEAHVILMCMSRKYKEDPSCQAEAEYAFSQKKKIIPLKMENGYIPDGWLGFLLGAKLFIDFSGKYPFETKITELKKEIAIFYKDEDTKDKVVPVKS
ncbi:hypothetical protein ACJMK2_004537 [Sinanodonta woodiana]|uniref:TIR domain-containing protein n=1 Tax=Sinanodonta woodiana TaxID=1069815 RepID=A0ABD3Y2Q3_SINWO